MDRRVAFISALGMVLAVVIAISAGGAPTQSVEECQSIENKQVCIEEVSGPDSLVVGERGNISITLDNRGSEDATSVLMLYIERPNTNTSEQIEIGRPSIQAGETATVTQTLNASTPGTHRIQFGAIDQETIQRYHLSEVTTIEVRTEPATGLGGPIDRTEIALGLFVLSLVGMSAVGYRWYRSR